MKGYKCRMGIEEGTYRDCPALDIGGCGFTAEEGPPANCDAIEYELIPAADYEAQQVALAAAEEVLALECDAKNLAYSVANEDEIHAKKVAALAQLRAVKKAE